uniref:Uncharacterized protein n=2 Tax=Caenorhabditis tropicalis TaxID=1561998 RepID=A0A1I7T5B2_9PELO
MRSTALVRSATFEMQQAGQLRLVRVEKRRYRRRSIACQVRSRDIPGFERLHCVGTDPLQTGVDFRENYDLVRSYIDIPLIEPKPRKRQNKKSPKNKSKSEKIEETGIVAEMPDKEEKYTGPLLNGSAPEMIVSSGALGMTNTKPKMQINYKQPPKKYSEDEDLYVDEDELDDYDDQPSCSSSIIDEAAFREAHRNPYTVVSERSRKVVTVKDYVNGDFELSNDILPPLNNFARPSENYISHASDFTSPDFVIEPSDVLKTWNPRRSRSSERVFDTIDESISSIIQTAVSGAPFPTDEVIELDDDDDDDDEESIEPIEEVVPEVEELDDETVQNEIDMLRQRELGRRFSEIKLSDFVKLPRDNRRSIDDRGEELLLTLRQNLSIIREKLGEYGERTIFGDVDKLTCALTGVSPDELIRVRQRFGQGSGDNGTDPFSEEAILDESEVVLENDEVEY